jgi:hypothetical protein
VKSKAKYSETLIRLGVGYQWLTNEKNKGQIKQNRDAMRARSRRTN